MATSKLPPFALLVIGTTKANPVATLYRPGVSTTAGWRSFISLPDCGLKSSHTMSPASGVYARPLTGVLDPSGRRPTRAPQVRADGVRDRSPRAGRPGSLGERARYGWHRHQWRISAPPLAR